MILNKKPASSDLYNHKYDGRAYKKPPGHVHPRTLTPEKMAEFKDAKSKKGKKGRK